MLATAVYNKEVLDKSLTPKLMLCCGAVRCGCLPSVTCWTCAWRAPPRTWRAVPRLPRRACSRRAVQPQQHPLLVLSNVLQARKLPAASLEWTLQPSQHTAALPRRAGARCRPAAQHGSDGAAGAQDLRCFAVQLFEDWRVLLEGQEASAGAALAARQVHADSRAPSWSCMHSTHLLLTLDHVTLLVTKKKFFKQ